LRLTAAFIAHEMRVARRSLRCRVFAAAYVALGCLPAALAYSRREHLEYAAGAGAYAAETLGPLTLLTAVLAGLLSLDGISRERGGGAWTTATLAAVGNGGYLLRRWLALLALILPLTAVPPLVAAGLAVAGGNAAEPAVFLGPWLLHVVPVAVAVSALALGLGTIGGNAALDRCGMRFGSALDWLDLREASRSAVRIKALFGKQTGWGWDFPLPVSESGFDARTAAEQSLADGLLLAALGAAALGVAALYLRRTRPDVRPQRIGPDHPLRNFLPAVARLRQQYAPDPAPAPADLAILALALLTAAGAVALEVSRNVRYERLGERRWQVETSGAPAPTPADVTPERWRIAGSFDAAGRVALQVTGTLHNTGSAPRGHLAFTLDPEIELAGAAADRGRLRVERAWDRLGVEIEPPIPPGGSCELRFRLTGRPALPRLPFSLSQGGERISFAHAYERHRQARFGADREDMSRSFTVPAVSGHRVELTAPALTPVPRYNPWTLYGQQLVPDESFFPPAQIELSLAVPRDLFVADSCGGVSDPAVAGKAGRLDSRCTLALAELEVAGGRQRRLAGTAESTAVAVFPAHRAMGELHLGFLANGTRMIDEAWPGLSGLGGAAGRMVLLEWPGAEVHDRNPLRQVLLRYFDSAEAGVTVIGDLVFLDESRLILNRALAPERMVAEIVAARLSRRRRLNPEESLFFRQLFRALALERLGVGSRSGAVVGPLPPQELPTIYKAALEARYSAYWSDRFPALVAALERRAGAEPLRASIEELLAHGDRETDQPATFAEFAAILTRRADGPVEPLLRDFFLAGKMPEPVLEGVAFQSAGSGWQVSGRVHNLGDGEALCRVVLTTDLGPVETTVRTGTHESAPFSLATPHRPQGVFLDPDQECHRLVRPAGTVDRVFFQGLQGARG